jgi:hypothetical protein
VPTDLDHVVVAVGDFARGVATLEKATGTALTVGWRAPLGTGGADVGGADVQVGLLALDRGRFLELVGPVTDSALTTSRSTLFAPYPAPTPIGWAVRAENVDSVRRALASRAVRTEPPRIGALQTPNGTRADYRALEGWPGVTTLMPFFVQWTPANAAPGRALAPQCSLERLALAFYAPDSLAVRIARADVHVAVEYTGAQTQGIHLTLRCPAGLVELPPRAP